MEIHLFPTGEVREKCLLLVGGSGDTAERFTPLVEQLSKRLLKHTICTFTMSSTCKEGESLLEQQAKELTEVVEQLVEQHKFAKFDLFCTSMGAYAAVKALVDPKYRQLFDKVIFFDPADYYLSSKFGSADGKLTWSGYMDYSPTEPLVSDELKQYQGEVTIHVVHLTLRNHGTNGYVEAKYEDRGMDHVEAFPRLNTKMVKRFYENTPSKNRGTYLEVTDLPHGFIRDGGIQSNLVKVANVITRLMEAEPEVKVLNVFVNEKGEYGNPVGIVVDEQGELSSKERQKISAKLGFSESVFVDDVKARKVSIYNPEHEVKFAGHALVGTAYYLRQLLGEPVVQIICKAGLVNVRVEGDKTWINASLENTPPWNFEELDGPDEVDDLSYGRRKKYKHTYVWAWIDKGQGVVRARTFAPDWGIPEDEANGSGSMQLASRLGRELEIHHGKGSVIYARPIGNNEAEVGGRVRMINYE